MSDIDLQVTHVSSMCTCRGVAVRKRIQRGPISLWSPIKLFYAQEATRTQYRREAGHQGHNFTPKPRGERERERRERKWTVSVTGMGLCVSQTIDASVFPCTGWRFLRCQAAQSRMRPSKRWISKREKDSHVHTYTDRGAGKTIQVHALCMCTNTHVQRHMYAHQSPNTRSLRVPGSPFYIFGAQNTSMACTSLKIKSWHSLTFGRLYPAH